MILKLIQKIFTKNITTNPLNFFQIVICIKFGKIQTLDNNAYIKSKNITINIKD
jgi:hypothetical protein